MTGKSSLTLDDDVNRPVGVQGREGGNGHPASILSARFVGGVVQVQHVTVTHLLSILNTPNPNIHTQNEKSVTLQVHLTPSEHHQKVL